MIYVLYVLYTMIKYKLKWAKLAKYGRRTVMIIPLVERFVDGKYDKFIPMNEAIKIINNAVINPDDKDTVFSKNEMKKSHISRTEKPVSTVVKKEKRSLKDFPTHISLMQ